MKRALAVGGLVTAALIATATPAMATKMIDVSGYDECSNGSSVIHWTVTNLSQWNIQLIGSSRPNVVAPDALIGANMGDYFTETLPPGTPSPQTLEVSWLTADQQTETDSATVELLSDCTPTPTTPPPTSPPPTTVPPTSPPPTSPPPPTHFTPPHDLAQTGISVAGPAFGGAILLALGMGLLWVTRKRAEV